MEEDIDKGKNKAKKLGSWLKAAQIGRRVNYEKG